MKPLKIDPVLRTLVLLAATLTLVAAAEDEPAFPPLFDPLRPNSVQLRLVAESVSDSAGYQTLEELVDLRLGRCALITTSKRGHQVTYIDSMSDLYYSYKPYACLAMSATEVEMSHKGLFSAKAVVTGKDGSSSEMHLYGLSALWLNAANSKKTYSKARMIHSASSNIITQAHKWSIKDPVNKAVYHMYFIENKQKLGGVRLSLETVEVESTEKTRISETINVLSFEYSIPEESQESLLQVPVGYGCMNAKATAEALIEFPSLDEIYMGPLLTASHRIELEATGTRYTNEGQRLSDTISYELARIKSDLVDTAQLIRQRDSKQDVKTVFNYDFNVQYQIDMRRGSCVMSNLGVSFERGERASLKFNNLLELDMGPELMHTLFVETTDFYFIKSSSQGGGTIEYLYFERTSGDLFDDRLARIVRTYSRDPNSSAGEVKLDSVTIWLFNEKVEKIVESYHLNIIEATEVESLVELAKMFDVSEECYLNDERMRSGRDYAWIELTYPMDAHHGEAVAAISDRIKESLLRQLSRTVSPLSIFVAPRVELMFEDTSFILRMLLIDIPPLAMLYDANDGLTLSASNTAAGALNSDLTVDVDHCAEMCRLINCAAMTYCETSHSCLISQKPVDDVELKLVKGNGCKTFTKPTYSEDFDSIIELRLHQVVSSFQHQDYGAFMLPPIPDELMLPSSETGVSPENRRQIYLEYVKALMESLEKGGNKLPALALVVFVGESTLTMMPNRFEVEEDPLSEFSLTDVDPLADGDKPPPFHEGLSMHRYKINVFSGSMQKNARLFSGLTYDQCALACIDGKCSSFSYCSHRQECILTDIYNIGDSVSNSLIEEDADCFISQRDFVSKFNRFQNVFRPQTYKSQTDAFNPAECAHLCMIESNFRCLAFDFCRTTQVEGATGRQKSSCFLLDERLIYTGAPTQSEASSGKVPANSKPAPRATGCDHFSRSYLADFNRIEYRQIELTQLAALKTTRLEGRSVDQCAEVCVNELTDCTAFQFCFDADSKIAMQTCTLIESPPKSGAADFQVVFNSSASGELVRAGKYFEPDQNCHVFAMRRDSTEAHLRDLALGSTTTEEEEARAKAARSTGGLSLGGGLLLYICITVLFAAIGCGLIVAKHQSEYLRQRIERLQIVLGI